MRMPRALTVALVGASIATSIATSDVAFGFCRTNTCDPDDPGMPCVTDAQGCLAGGLPLRWAGRCPVFSIHETASPLRDITFDQANQVISGAFIRWMQADCGGAAPDLDIQPTDPVPCSTVEFNETRQNANIWTFRDDAWPYEDNGHTLALTTVTFNVDTGEIFDADVEINTNENLIAVDASRAEADLPSIATHEAGHFLGLSHSNVSGSTMSASYALGDQSLRSLHPDDTAGICAAYPPNDPDNDFCGGTPIRGFSPLCGADQIEAKTGCAASPRGPSRGALGWALVGLAAASLVAARRRRNKKRG